VDIIYLTKSRFNIVVTSMSTIESSLFHEVLQKTTYFVLLSISSTVLRAIIFNFLKLTKFSHFTKFSQHVSTNVVIIRR
jgi:hypothetical protein